MQQGSQSFTASEVQTAIARELLSCLTDEPSSALSLADMDHLIEGVFQKHDVECQPGLVMAVCNALLEQALSRVDLTSKDALLCAQLSERLVVKFTGLDRLRRQLRALWQRGAGVSSSGTSVSPHTTAASILQGAAGTCHECNEESAKQRADEVTDVTSHV